MGKVYGFRVGNTDPNKRGLHVTIRNKKRAKLPTIKRVFGKKWSFKKVIR